MIDFHCSTHLYEMIMWLLFSSVIMFSGCGPKKVKLPCWVTTPRVTESCGGYSEKEYIIGRGNAESQVLADDLARAEIAKRFQVQISQVQSSEKSARSFSTETGVNLSSRQSLQTNTVASVAMELQGVEIGKQHEAGVLYYALAVLKRGPLLTQLDDQLTKLDKESRGLVTKARAAVSKLERASAYHQAIPLLSEMELLNQRRVVVHPQGISWDFFASSLQVQREEEETMRTIQIQLTSDQTSKDVLPTLIEDLTLQGFTVVQGEPDLLLSVEGIESMVPPDTFGFSQTRLAYDLKITEPNNGSRIVLERTLLGEASSQDLFKSRQFALKNIQNDLIEDSISSHLKRVILGESL